MRDTGRETLDAKKALEGADEGGADAATKRLEDAAARFDAASEAFAKQDDGIAETDPKPCEADVEDA